MVYSGAILQRRGGLVLLVYEVHSVIRKSGGWWAAGSLADFGRHSEAGGVEY